MPEIKVEICVRLHEFYRGFDPDTRGRIQLVRELKAVLPTMVSEALFEIDRRLDPENANQQDLSGIEIATSFVIADLSVNFPPIKISLTPGTWNGRRGDAEKVSLRTLLDSRLSWWIANCSPGHWNDNLPDIVVNFADTAGVTYDQTTREERYWNPSA